MEISRDQLSPVILSQKLLFLPIDAKDSQDYFTGEYVLKIYGNLENGSKIIVNIYDIKCYCDILINENNKDEFDNIIKENNIEFELINKFPVKYFQDKKQFKRIYFNNHNERMKMLEFLQSKNYETYSDDLYNHYRKISRELKLSYVNYYEITNYYIKNAKEIEISINDFIKYKDKINDKILILTWDIETYSDRGSGEIPSPEYVEDEVFMICMTLHWKDNINFIKKICLCTCVANVESEWDYVYCISQEDLILKFSKIIHNIYPDIMIGFNDSQYDWPFILTKAEKLNILEKFVSNIISRKVSRDYIRTYMIKKKTIKIAPGEEMESTILKVPGILMFDVRVMFKKLYPKEGKSSLNHFLRLCNLDEKFDLNHVTLWKYYRDSKFGITDDNVSRVNINTIAKYCMIDALRCMELITKRNVLNNYKEKADLAYVTLTDEHFNAGGMKVRQLIGAYAHDRDILITMRQNKIIETGKYPGAYVYYPKKGLERKLPVAALDFASLYPNIMMNYNLSLDKMILDSDEVERLKDQGYKLHHVKFEYNDKTRSAWFVQHNNVDRDKGVYVILLEDLLRKRNEEKKKLKILEKKLEYLSANQMTDESIEFEYNCVNAKQLALKIYMNSFYGETGNPLSSFFAVELAGGVTLNGQKLLKNVANYILDRNYSIKYGDTDSLYFTLPNHHYRKCKCDWLNIKKTFIIINAKKRDSIDLRILKEKYYYGEKVIITMNVLSKLNKEINNYLYEITGSHYLKMAYEEILFPALFIKKKKYVGIPHINVPNFHPKKIFNRGIDYIKQGHSDFLREIGKNIVLNVLNIHSKIPTDKVIEDVIKQYMKYDKVESFVKTASWKPTKKNISVHGFINRMTQSKQKLPEPGERFSYVIAQSLSKKISDKMEYPENVIKIDHKYYLKSIVSLCASLVSYFDDFQPVSNMLYVDNEDEKDKIIDTYSQQKAEEFIKLMVERIDQNRYNDITKYMNIVPIIVKKRNFTEFKKFQQLKLIDKPLIKKSKKSRVNHEVQSNKITNYFHTQ